MKYLLILGLLFGIAACSSATKRGDAIVVIDKKNEKSVTKLDCKSIGMVKLGTFGQNYSIGGGDSNMDRLRTKTADEGANVLVTAFSGESFKTAKGVGYNCTQTALSKLREEGLAF